MDGEQVTEGPVPVKVSLPHVLSHVGGYTPVCAAEDDP